MDSPGKKKPKLTPKIDSHVLNPNKREYGDDGVRKKRRKTVNMEEELRSLKKKNFVKACEIASYKSYCNLRQRIRVVELPNCAKPKHEHDHEIDSVAEMSSNKTGAFSIAFNKNMWHEALTVCRVCSTSKNYLSAEILKDIAEIMLNAHEDDFSKYTITEIITQCQLVLAQNFSYHPPCVNKRLRKCYLDFLTSPMKLKGNILTNRKQFKCEEGVIKYCLNRLEYELTMESKDQALIDKQELIPKEFKDGIKSLHWQKENFELYEFLERNDRINRLMALLEIAVELLQVDLAIWHSRYSSHLNSHIMRSHRPLMTFILWSSNVLFTGCVTNTCRQILKIFTYLIHLKCPQKHIHIFTNWLNLTVQTFYTCETNENSDYPNIGKYCTTFAKDFYKIISVLPHSSIIRIIKAIQPSFMQYLVGNLHINKLLQTEETCVLTNLIFFLKEKKWTHLSILSYEIEIPKKKNRKSLSDNHFSNLCKKFMQASMEHNSKNISEGNIIAYPKFNPDFIVEETSLNHIVEIFYVTLDSYLNAYSVQTVQDSIDKLNELLKNPDDIELEMSRLTMESSYSVTEQFIKKYRSIYQHLNELVIILQEMKNNDTPHMLRIFGNIDLIGL